MPTDETIYRMSGIEYTYDELIEALESEVGPLDPEQQEDGWDADGAFIDALLVGAIEMVDSDDDPDDVGGMRDCRISLVLLAGGAGS